MELNLVRDIKNNKGFSKYASDKRKSRENVDPSLKEVEDLVTKTMEKAEVLNAFSTSVFSSETSFQESQAPGNCEKLG